MDSMFRFMFGRKGPSIPSATHAIVRGIPDSFTHALKMSKTAPAVDIKRARRQHFSYVAALRRLVPTVIELDPDEAHPDCCFVEDTAVAVHNRVVVTAPGHASRRNEGGPLQRTLADLGVEVFAMRDMNTDARCDGGDVLVLHSRKHIFCGISSRTNVAGAEVLRAVFEPVGYRVTDVLVPKGLHLKSAVTELTSDHLLCAGNSAGVILYKAISELEPYEGVFVPEEQSNVVAVNNGLLVPRPLHPGIMRVLRSVIDSRNVLLVDKSEVAKVDGALTCGCLLFDVEPPA